VAKDEKSGKKAGTAASNVLKEKSSRKDDRPLRALLSQRPNKRIGLDALRAETAVVSPVVSAVSLRLCRGRVRATSFPVLIL
jgi:hypothetical protein